MKAKQEISNPSDSNALSKSTQQSELSPIRSPTNLQPLPVPVPPTLELALGYRGDERYLTVFWTEGGSQLVWDDGIQYSTANWQNWVAFTDHPKIHPTLQRYRLQSGQISPIYVIDRKTRRLFGGHTIQVMLWFIRQPSERLPSPTPIPIENKTLRQLFEALDLQKENDAQQSQNESEQIELLQEIQRRMVVEAHLVIDIFQWLDQHAIPPTDNSRIQPDTTAPTEGETP